MTQIRKAYKVEIAPNKAQAKMLYQHCAAVCKVWNFYLDERTRIYKDEKRTVFAMHKGESQKLTAFKQANPWLYEVSSTALVQCLRDQDQAFSNFFRRLKLITQGKLSPKEAGFPKYKSVRRSKDRGFRFREGVKIDGNRIYFPRIGWIKSKEKDYIPNDVKPANTTIRQTAGRWFASLNIEEEVKDREASHGKIIAVHFGIRNKITCSNGLIIDKFLPYHRAEKRLARLQHRKDKPPPGWSNGKDKSYLSSKNKRKLQAKIAKLHYRTANMRKDATHKATTQIITSRPEIIILEQWDNKYMLKDRRFAKGISDTSFYEPRRQLEYKAEWAGIKIIHTGKGFKSSKTCSECGNIYEEFGLQKIFQCPVCGHTEDRDQNAVKNVLQEGLKQLQPS